MGSQPNPILMKQARYAEHRGVSRQCISNPARRGILVMRGRLVDVQASDAVPDDEPKPQASELHVEAGGRLEKRLTG